MAKDAGEYQYWSKTADHFDVATTYIVGAKTQVATQAWLKDQLAATDIALEIGCGTGAFSTVIAEHVQHLTATDMSPEMLAQARQRLRVYPNVEVKSADGYQIAYAESAFDIVFLGNVLHIVQEPVTVLRECQRVLKRGGRVLVIDYTMAGMTGTAKLAMAARYLSQYGMPPRANKNYQLEELAELVRQPGFEIKVAQLITQETNAICLRAAKP